MIAFDAVRSALLSDQPWSRMDDLVRAELASGRTTAEIYATLHEMADQVAGIAALSEDGEDAFGDTLDALLGNCHPDCRYQDASPNTHPSWPTRPSSADPTLRLPDVDK
jgi:hypothetical protein